MELEVAVRKLAKSNKYQTLYTLFKENGMQFFKNTTEYTSYQILFLNYLGMYDRLFTEVAINDIDERVIEDDILADAFLYYRRKHKETLEDIERPKDNKKTEAKENQSFSWLMKQNKQ